ncbi:hypothetical protein GCM10027594_01390 [Hymenobacter agri]
MSDQPTPDEDSFIVLNGRRLRAVNPKTPREKLQQMDAEIDYRFVREVEELEYSGRVESRNRLELSIGLEAGGINNIRNGVRGVTKVNIVLLQQLYRADLNYILFDAPRNKELTNPYIPGVGRLDKFEPYVHRYLAPARWKAGPRPETRRPHPDGEGTWAPSYPADPDNKKWTKPSRAANPDSSRSRKKAEREAAQQAE